MRFSQRILMAAVATTAMVASTGAAMAHGLNGSTMNMIVPDLHSYSGAWPVTITGSQFSNGTDCLTLTQNGSNGGSASLVKDGQKYPYGSFVVVNHILMVNISEPLYGQNGAMMFAASANHGHVGQGIFENVEGGSNFDFGALAFGMKGGC
jgi:hypothetical protein